jgi:hypothetical protein
MPMTKTLLCDCNRVDAAGPDSDPAALAKTPGASAEGVETPHTLLCRREAAAFQRAAKSGRGTGGVLHQEVASLSSN